MHIATRFILDAGELLVRAVDKVTRKDWEFRRSPMDPPGWRPATTGSYLAKHGGDVGKLDIRGIDWAITTSGKRLGGCYASLELAITQLRRLTDREGIAALIVKDGDGKYIGLDLSLVPRQLGLGSDSLLVQRLQDEQTPLDLQGLSDLWSHDGAHVRIKQRGIRFKPAVKDDGIYAVVQGLQVIERDASNTMPR